MKLNVLLLMACFLNVSANVRSQNISFSGERVPLKSVLSAVEKQTEFVFVYTKPVLQNSKPVTINAKNVPLEQFLTDIFSAQQLAFEIRGKNILILPKLLPQRPDVSGAGIAASPPSPIRGRVLDENGKPLAGASVSIKNSRTTEIADTEGVFNLNVTDGDVLVISYVGYQSKEIKITSSHISSGKISISLTQETKKMEDIVVVGYGNLRKKDFVGSSSNVNEKVIKETPPTTLENALTGRMAGVNISNTSAEPGGGISIQIRGITSLSGGTQPLYVIDGVPMFNDNSRSSSEFEGNVPTNFLATINPSDILSVEVLKDASSTAIYGSRGANGVILITTKSGRVGKAKIEFSHYTMSAQAPKPIPLANAKEYANFYNTYAENSSLPQLYTGQWVKSSNNLDSLYFPSASQLGEGTNWQKEIFRNAVTQNYELNVSGGNQAIKYMLSGNFLTDQGVVKLSKYQRGSLRANMDVQATSKLTIKFDATLMKDVNDRAENSNARGLVGGFERSGVILKSFAANPVWPPDNTTSRQQGNFSNTQFYLTMLNPLFDLENTINQRRVNYTLANVDLNYKFSPSLDLTVRGGYNAADANNDMYWNLNSQLGYLRGQKTYQSSTKSASYLNENFLTFRRQTTKYSLNVIAGVSWQKGIQEATVLGGENLPIPTNNGLYLLPYYSALDVPWRSRTDELLLSGYGRLSFSYDSRYLLTFTARADGSSHFAENKKWAFFPSAGLGWNFTQEKFLKSITPVVSTGKLRVSYGTSGNQAIAAYQSLSSLSPVSWGFVSGVSTGVITANAGNTDLTWETTSQIDAGLEMGFLKDRFRFSLDLYRKKTDNLLQSKAVLSQSGYSSVLSNFGSIENKGVELELSANVMRNKKFQWDASFNVSANRNKVLDLGPGIKYYNYSSGATGGNDYTHRLTVGGQLGTFWGYKTDGLLTAKDIADGYPKLAPNMTEGQIKVVDVNKDGIINDEDKVDLGHAFPKYTMGLSNVFTYKNFSFNVFLQAVLGQKILDQNLVWSEYGSLTGIPTKRYINDYWSPNHTNAYYPKPSGTNPNYQTMDRLVQDGSFVRIKLVSLRYNFTHLPTWLSKLQAYATVNNLYTFTKYNGYDPEVSAYGQNNLLAGIDFGSYPRTRSFVLGIEVGF